MATIEGGDKLKAELERIAKNLKKGAAVEVGFLEGATYPDGTSVPMVAAIQEFGAPKVGIPARPFFRNMIADKSGEWGPALSRILPSVDYDAAKALDLMGEGIEGELRDSIIDTTEPPLSETTLMLRKMRSEDPSLVVTGKTVGEAAARVHAGESAAGVSTKPLIDTGHMLNSVAHKVK